MIQQFRLEIIVIYPSLKLLASEFLTPETWWFFKTIRLPFLLGFGPFSGNDLLLVLGKILPVHPWRLTWNIIMEVWKIIFLSKWVICRFHVNLPGCICFFLKLPVNLPCWEGFFSFRNEEGIPTHSWILSIIPSCIERLFRGLSWGEKHVPCTKIEAFNRRPTPPEI